MDLTLWKRVFRYAYSLVGNDAEAEDLTQQAFVELFRAQAAGKPVYWIGGWMRTFTKRLAYRSYHDRRSYLQIPLETTTEYGEDIPWDMPDSGTRRRSELLTVDGASECEGIECFSERERECVLMYFRGYDFVQNRLSDRSFPMDST